MNPALSKNLETIIYQILRGLSAQKNEFTNYFYTYLIQNHPGLLMENENNLQKIIEYHILQSIMNVGLKMTGTLHAELPALGYSVLTEDLVQGRRVYQHLWKKIGILLLFLLPLGIAFDLLRNIPLGSNFTLFNIGFFFLGIYFLQDGNRQFHTHLKFRSTEFEQTGKLNYDHLELINIVDFKHHNVVSSVYVPTWESPQNIKTSIPTDRGFHETKSLPDISLSQSKARYLPNLSQIPAIISYNLMPSWDAAQILYGKKDQKIPGNRIHKLYVPFKKTCFYGFFNEEALKKQKLKENDPEWKNYQARIEQGHMVSSHGQTGIKQLNPAILSRVKIAGEDFGERLFSLAAKNIGTTYRLLGTVAGTQKDSEGVQHKLFDFCWHLPKGPGH